MLEKEVQEFLNKSFLDLGEFSYELEKDEEFLIVNFTEIFSSKVEKEIMFKIIDDSLYLHSTSFGFKKLIRDNIKFFWIELLSEY
ncbi:MAG: hypothetical protein MJK08_09385 [Campylobacterales bacterium]|nr:hypothetical protein [Campylobacterales bacterium]